MPYWYYDKEALSKTPSIQDGISYKTECRYRKEGARFIIDMGSQMDLGHNTVATGVVYFHRFYMFHSFKSFPRYVTACCCLFLAGKVEETPKKCKDIIKVAKAMLNEKIFETFGEDPKEEVMTLEKILLQTMKFDLQVQHPYSYLIKYAKCFEGDKNKLQKMVQMAWTFINDSLCTTLSIQWEPEIIAIALTYLATKLSKFEILNWAHRQRHHIRWWDVFVKDLKMETLEDICHQVLDLYSPLEEEPDSSPVQTLEQHVQQPTQLTVKNELFATPPVKDGTSQLSIKSEPLDVQFSIENGPFNTQLSIENEPFSRKLSIENEPITSKLSNKNESLTQVSVKNEPFTQLSVENDSLTQLSVKNEPFTQLSVKNESLTQLSVKNEPFTQLSVKNESLTQLSVKNEPFAEQADTKWSVKTEPVQPKESAINHTSTISPRDPRLHGHSTPLNEDFHNQPTASCTSMSSSSSTVSPGYTVFSPSFTIPNFSVPPPNFKPTKDNDFPPITKGFGTVNTFETLKGAKILSNAQKKRNEFQRSYTNSEKFHDNYKKNSSKFGTKHLNHNYQNDMYQRNSSNGYQRGRYFKRSFDNFDRGTSGGFRNSRNSYNFSQD